MDVTKKVEKTFDFKGLTLERFKYEFKQWIEDPRRLWIPASMTEDRRYGHYIYVSNESVVSIVNSTFVINEGDFITMMEVFPWENETGITVYWKVQSFKSGDEEIKPPSLFRIIQKNINKGVICF